jgi:acyl carrier protein
MVDITKIMAMNIEPTVEKVIEIVAAALEVAPELITIETDSSEIEEWDSLGQISILAKLDEVFSEVTERIPDLASAVSIKEIHQLLSKPA